MQRSRLPGVFIYSFFCVLTLALFSNTITKPFLSDDYDVLYRLTVQKQFFIEGFFRPLSDLTIYLCYLIGGLQPAVFNVFNLLVHATSCFILYRFCLVCPLFPDTGRQWIAWTASVLFLIYPFHSESVIWMVGRASAISNLFGFLSLLLAFSNLPKGWRYFAVCACYFTGLASYETIFLLPVILFVFQYQPHKSFRSYLPLYSWLSVTLILHVLVRNWYAKSFAGQYGDKIFMADLSVYAGRFLKVTGRLLLPPSVNSALLAGLYIGGILVIAVVSFLLLKQKKEARVPYLKLLAAVLVACIIPGMFGINTQTAEGDRLIYFASFFFISWLSFFLWLIPRKPLRNVAFALVSLYFLLFLGKSIKDWNTAGTIVQRLLNRIQEERSNYASLGFVNIPEEENGAFVFRVGFPQALLINKIDTSGITLLRKMTSGEAAQLPPAIKPVTNGGILYLAPGTQIQSDSVISIVHPEEKDTITTKYRPFQQILYWNKKDLVQLY